MGGKMRRHAVRVIISVVALQTGFAAALAQEGQTEAPPPATSPAAPGSPVVMEEPAPGDYWTYEIRDEILGTLKFSRQSVVTEVTPTEIGTRFNITGSSNNGVVVFDRSWNRTSRGEWRYKPNDGSGIQLPLAVGKSWSFKSNNVNSKNGDSWSFSGASKVVGQESVTTKAGTFDTFKIETTLTGHNVHNPSRTTQSSNEMWYAPSVDHWIKRNYKVRVDGHLLEDTSEVLVAYGRRQ
jgi:hypothetical protein